MTLFVSPDFSCRQQIFLRDDDEWENVQFTVLLARYRDPGLRVVNFLAALHFLTGMDSSII